MKYNHLLLALRWQGTWSFCSLLYTYFIAGSSPKLENTSFLNNEIVMIIKKKKITTFLIGYVLTILINILIKSYLGSSDNNVRWILLLSLPSQTVVPILQLRKQSERNEIISFINSHR